MHESFLRHRHWFYLRVAAALSLVSILAYAVYDPVDGPSGHTWLGYTLGTIGAGLIVWLSLLGVRKRQYRSQAGSVKGWVSAHVYLGLALLVVATLHAAFQFGWNLHTLCYGLMVLVIASGAVGVVVYSRYPALITGARAQATRDAWLNELFDLNEQSIKLADSIGAEVHRVVVRSADRVRVGGNGLALLFGAGGGEDVALPTVNERLRKLDSGFTPEHSQQTMMFMASQIIKGRAESEGDRLRRLLDLIAQRNELAARINRDLQMHARMQVWLYLHVPLTGALLAALAAHILSVFLYW